MTIHRVKLCNNNFLPESYVLYLLKIFIIKIKKILALFDDKKNKLSYSYNDMTPPLLARKVIYVACAWDVHK